MPQTPPRDARELAGELLARTRATGPCIADLFDSLAEASGLDSRDRGLALEIANGVVRHRRTLDAVLAAFSNRPIVKSPVPLRILLRLGAYQLLFLDRVPGFAAVDETVELAKRWARPRIKKHPASIAGFVNGILRALAGGVQTIERGDQSAHSARRVIERPVCESLVLLDRDVLADPQTEPAEHLADAYSFNSWLAARWVDRLGLPQARELARAQNRRASLTLRVNTLRTTIEAVRDMLIGDGVDAAYVRGHVPLLRVLEGDALNSKAMQLGLIQPQDPWSASVVGKLHVKPGMTVLDRCAAPGTKTSQIVELMEDRGTIFAVDVAPEGLERITTNVRRMGGHIVRSILAEDLPKTLMDASSIDRALADVPCSNSGVLARRPEARWRIDAESLAELNRTQRELLMDALNWVAPGGKVVYSTCSIEPEENDQVVQYAIHRRRGQVRLLEEKATLPSLRDDHDGGYWAILERVR